jgi:hypothetical protein
LSRWQSYLGVLSPWFSKWCRRILTNFWLSIPGTEALELHHLYRAMAFLGQQIEPKGQKTSGSPRRLKDLIEEELFERRRDLFTEVDLVFFDNHLSVFRRPRRRVNR